MSKFKVFKSTLGGIGLFLSLNIICIGLFVASAIFSLLFYVGDLIPENGIQDLPVTQLTLLVGLAMLALAIELTKIILSYYKGYINSKNYEASISANRILNVSLFLSIMASMAFFQKYAENFSPANGIVSLFFSYIPIENGIVSWIQSIIVFSVNICFSGLIEILIIKLPYISICWLYKESIRKYTGNTIFSRVKDYMAYKLNKKLDSILVYDTPTSPLDERERVEVQGPGEKLLKRPKLKLLKSQNIVKTGEYETLAGRDKIGNKESENTTDRDENSKSLIGLNDTKDSLKSSTDVNGEITQGNQHSANSERQILEIIQNNLKGNICPGVDKISELTGIDRKEVREVRKDLIDKGVLEVKGNKTVII